MAIELIKKHKSFEGYTSFWQHESKYTKTKMKFSTFVPRSKPKSCIIWLSGLTCTEENFITKAGAQIHLAETNTMIICPDTSPRGLNLPGEHDGWDFGSGASFYVDATNESYKENYHMYSYVNEEIYEIIQNEFDVNNISIMGHSMGGHGALVIGLRNPTKYQSITAFAPIANPINCPWGQKAFTGYLGNDTNAWEDYDATSLVKSDHRHPRQILIEQGLEDEFLAKQLLLDNFVQACKQHNQDLKVNYREGYDHGYYFVSSFIDGAINIQK